MSHAYNARFAPAPLSLDEMLARLEPCLAESGIDFDGEIVRLHEHEGTPNVLSLATEHASTLAEVGRRARSWYGVGLDCVSRPLFDVLGRTESIEVYLQIFEKAPSMRMLIYNESSGAFRARTEDESLTKGLVASLICMSTALGVDFAVYDEDDGEANSPNHDEIMRRLTQQAEIGRVPDWLAIVNAKLLTMQKARQLAGSFADRIQMSTAGYIVLPFLGQ